MARFRKKPVEVEATIFDGGKESFAEVLRFCPSAAFYPATGQVGIPTLEGWMTASVGDYIIQGVAGEVYPCKPEIFLQTYEAVNPVEAPDE